MFRKTRQRGFIPVFQSTGSSPLEIWDVKVKNGSVRRVTDEDVRALALDLTSTNVTTCYIRCPKEPKQELGIYLPYFVMIVKNLKKYFTFEITVLDDRNVQRRFRLSNFQRMTRVHHFSTTLPLCLDPGWNEVYFDLTDFTRNAYGTNYVETTRIQINANCRVRVIYFCDRIYDEKDIPAKFKLFLPINHSQSIQKAADKTDAISTPIAEIDGIESYGSEGEEGEEEGDIFYDQADVQNVPSHANVKITLTSDKNIEEQTNITPPSNDNLDNGEEHFKSQDLNILNDSIEQIVTDETEQIENLETDNVFEDNYKHEDENENQT